MELDLYSDVQVNQINTHPLPSPFTLRTLFSCPSLRLSQPILLRVFAFVNAYFIPYMAFFDGHFVDNILPKSGHVPLSHES